MTCNVFSGTLNPTQSVSNILQDAVLLPRSCLVHIEDHVGNEGYSAVTW